MYLNFQIKFNLHLISVEKRKGEWKVLASIGTTTLLLQHISVNPNGYYWPLELLACI